MSTAEPTEGPRRKDPVVEAFRRDVDVTLLEENLRAGRPKDLEALAELEELLARRTD